MSFPFACKWKAPSKQKGFMCLPAGLGAGRGGLNLPSIPDDNASFNDEGTATTGWSASNCTLGVTGSVLRATKTNAAGGGCIASKTLTFTPTNRDYVLYIRARSSAAATNDIAFIWFLNGSKEVSISLNRNHTSGYQAGTVSMNGTTGLFTQNQAVAETGLDLVNIGVDIALQFDSKHSSLIYWARESDGRWKYKARVACNWFDSTTISIVKGSGAPLNSWVEIDWLTLAKPNIISIGDSICAGATLYNPDPALGLTNDESTWMRHAPIYPALRNNLIVNKGVGSQSSTQINARITDATAEGPRVVFLHASTNDEALGISKATRTTNIQNSTNSIVAASAACVLLNAMYGTAASADNTPTPDLRDYMLDWWDNYRPTLTGVFASIDIMQPLLSGGFMNAALTQADGIHPIPAGGYSAIGLRISS